LMYVQNSKMLI